MLFYVQRFNKKRSKKKKNEVAQSSSYVECENKDGTQQTKMEQIDTCEQLSR